MVEERYKNYLNFIELIATRLGFTVDLECLRTPSTKNLCFTSCPQSPQQRCKQGNDVAKQEDEEDKVLEEEEVAQMVRWLRRVKSSHPRGFGS